MKKINVLFLLCFAVAVQAQNFIQAYQDRANQVLQTNITTNLQQFGNLGVKTTGSTNNVNALNWIKNKYLSYGYSASQISEDPFTFGSTSSKNLIITKVGTLYPNTYVIICGHFDTISGPGVSDNGSGTSIMLEAARILKDIPTEYSIKFIHFSGEEQGLIGSTHYVNTVAYQNNVRQLDIRLVFNIDQVGGQLGNLNNTIFCDQDQGNPSVNNAASQAVTQQLATCTGLYSPLQTAIDPAYASDYMPFEDKGEVITGFYEYERSYNEHTPNDTFANVDPVYVYNVGKAAVGALQHFAVASVQNLGVNETYADDFQIYPNPTKDFINIVMPGKIKDFSFTLTDIAGTFISRTENTSKIDISRLQAGVYIGMIEFDDKKITKKIIITK
ncbi:M28 family peptidase [Chryseobacterium sp.]|uniref:M28 family peptidase n=1 Tax=Chryseobacterium sp. TaxID=1871047 RepID=UPI0011C9ED51|nr:M28 family peptidase [Chryseobacterium sp.]TXF79442.1 M28 family peptidase [Chryseobacterium sp.]